MDMMVDLLVQQPGIGEMRPLAPALAPALSKVYLRRIATLQPPHVPQAVGLASLGVPSSSMLWLRAERAAKALCVVNK